MRFLFLTAALAGFVGCSSAPPLPPASVTRGPHDGTALVLPEGKGIVELVNEPEVRDRRAGVATAVVAYFLQADGQSAMSPAPTAVKFALHPGVRQPSQVVPLTPEPRPDDPAAAARFVSKPGPYDLAAVRGTLTATVAGAPVSVDFGGGR